MSPKVRVHCFNYLIKSAKRTVMNYLEHIFDSTDKSNVVLDGFGEVIEIGSSLFVVNLLQFFLNRGQLSNST